MTIRLHRGDLPSLSAYKGAVAIDTETMGLDPRRDRLCVVQLSPGDGSADVVQIAAGQKKAPNIEKLLADPSIVKIFHYARFDLAVLSNAFGVMAGPVYCTKIASRLARTYTDKHGLKDLTREVLGVDLSKQQQSSDWGAETLTDAAGHLRGHRRAASACAAGEARRDAGARGPHRTGGGLLRLPAASGAARSRRLGRAGHFLAFVLDLSLWFRALLVDCLKSPQALSCRVGAIFGGTVRSWGRIGNFRNPKRSDRLTNEPGDHSPDRSADRALLLDHEPRRQRARVSRRAPSQPRGAHPARRHSGGGGAAAWRLFAGHLFQSAAHAQPSCRSIISDLVVSGTKITMEKPRLSGFTKDARAYEFNADAAAQDLTKPDIVELHNIRAKMQMQDQSMIDMTAETGIYDTKRETLKLDSNIVLISSNGNKGRLSEAMIDVSKGNVVSDQPVELEFLQGVLNAKQLEIVDSGDLVRFHGGVDMMLMLNEYGLPKPAAGKR